MSVISLTGYEPSARYDGNPWTAARIEGTSDLATWAAVELFTFDDPDEDPSVPAERNFTTALVDPSQTYVRVVFLDDDGNQEITGPVLTSPAVPLASVGDVQVRLGRNLSDAEEAQVNLLLTVATTNIINAVDKDEAWEIPPTVKPLLSMMCVELVTRAMANPQALGQISETIGARSYTTTFPREIPGSGIMLTELEELMLRRAVWGQNAGTERGYNDVLVDGLVDQQLREPMVWIGEDE
jgi:hypothetical protein